MSPSLFFSGTRCCLFVAAPTAWVSMKRVALLRALPSLSSPASCDSPVGQGREKKQQPLQLQGHSDGMGLEELSLRIQDRLAKINERVAHTDTTIQQQTSAFSLMQRQQAVLERRVVALEDEAARMQQRIAETTRLASDIALQHRNVESLVRQMEKLVLKHTSSVLSSSKIPLVAEGHLSSGLAPPSSNEGKKEANDLQVLMKTKPKAPGVVTCSETSSSPVAAAEVVGQVAALATRIEELQARLDQLTMEKLVMDGIQVHAQQQQPKEREVEVAVARVAAAATATTIISSGEAGKSALSSKALATVLRNTGAFPFKDNDGTTRISSQKVLVRGIPPNFGAGEVRDLFSRVGVVLSCVVRRTPAAIVAEGMEAPKCPRYRSQQHEPKATEEGGKGEPHHRSAADEKPERAFEVTFKAVEHAVRAVLELHRYQLDRNCIILVEPLLAADVIAALRQLEREPNVPGIQA